MAPWITQWSIATKESKVFLNTFYYYLFIFCVFLAEPEGDVVGQSSHVDRNQKDVAETRADMSFIFCGRLGSPQR